MPLDHDACYRIFLARDARFDGRVFVGVRTTGIYCRPICPAPPPKQANVDFFTSASAAQEAGFRPCLRCRPDISPDFAAWRGSSNTVSRALRLIEGGALDRMSVEAFSDLLGVGERQLRRLFVNHVGAPPTAFAQTRRVHMAKQLIQETNLPLIQVALASGYGSVRQFNDAFRAMFGRPPGSLRRASENRTSKDGGVVLHLSFAPPYDWNSIVGTLSKRAIAGVEHVSTSGYRRTISLDGAVGSISVEPADGDRLRVEVDFPRLQSLPEVAARVRGLFDLGADPLVLLEHLGGDVALETSIAARPGLRVAGCWDGFELVVRSVLGESLMHAPPTLALSTFAQAFGVPLERAHSGLSHVFPEPETVCERDMSVLCLERWQVLAIASFAELAARGKSPLKLHAQVGDVASLLAGIPGFNGDIAQAIASRFVQPTDDVSGVEKSLLDRIERWRPWRAYAASHLTSDASTRSRRHAAEKRPAPVSSLASSIGKLN